MASNLIFTDVLHYTVRKMATRVLELSDKCPIEELRECHHALNPTLLELFSASFGARYKLVSTYVKKKSNCSRQRLVEFSHHSPLGILTSQKILIGERIRCMMAG